MRRKKRKDKRKLSIAQLHWGFPPHIGGVETHLHIMLPQMTRSGCAVGLLTGSIEGAKARYKYKGTDVFRTPLMDLNWLFKRGTNGLDGDIQKTISEFINRTDPDIIHCHNMHYFSKAHAKVVEKMAHETGAPLVLTAHNVWDDMLFLDLLQNIKWTHIIAVSHFIKRELIGAGYDDRKITVIHHGIDTRIFRPGVDTSDILKKHPRLKNKKIIFHPARIGLAKGCDTSIKAMNLIRKRFPEAMLEALASAKPMIVTDSGGMPEIIRDGINGYVIPIKDFEVLASRVIQILSDDRLRERLGYTGKQMVDSYYTQRQVTKNTLDLYHRLLRKR